MFESPVRRPSPEVLRWLIRHRWLAVIGQTGAILVAVIGFGLRFEPLPLVGGLLVLALSNHFLLSDDGPERAGARRIGGVLALDVALLTWMLYWTGGRANPFVLCYLLNVVLAAMLLGRRGLIGIGMLSVGGYVWISLRSVPLGGNPAWIEKGWLVPDLAHVAGSFALVLIGGILGVFVFAMKRDVLAGERALRETSRRLAETERFKSLATLAAGVAHELGTPLGTIAVSAKELERHLAMKRGDNDAMEDATLIRREVERCRDILRRLDRRTTGGTGNAAERVRLGGVGDALRDRLSPAFARRLEIECGTPDTEVWLPEEAVLQSLVVLVENACEADEGGKPVEILIDLHERRVRFRVRDRGPGVTESVRRRVWEPYFTTKRHEGSGLGLFLVRTLTLEWGGEVSLDPLMDGGTCATLVLPLHWRGDESDRPHPDHR